MNRILQTQGLWAGLGVASLAGLLATLAACTGRSSPAQTPSAAPESAEKYQVQIRRTDEGVGHIKANDYGSLGYGYARTVAEDNLCKLAELYLTLSGERSRYFGAEIESQYPGNSFVMKNQDLDFFFQLLKARGQVDALVNQPLPQGPSPEMRELIRGYVAGYNAYVRKLDVDAIKDPRCRGAAWVREIAETDVYRAAFVLATWAGVGASAMGVAQAQPSAIVVPGEEEALIRRFSDPQALPSLKTGLPLGIGSNAVAVGGDASVDGRGVLLGNPHLGWKDYSYLYPVHLTIPGTMDIAGVSFMGLPFVVIGTTGRMAWTHTVSSAFRFVPVQLVLDGGTRYLVDGKLEEMQAWPLSIQALQADGSLARMDRTLYTTRYGPMITNMAGGLDLPWSPVLGFALMDPNTEHMRYLNHFQDFAKAQSVRDAKAVLERWQGLPWANTIAADAAGEALYADITVAANISDAHGISCGLGLGQATFALLGLPVLDGSRSACTPPAADDAMQPGILGLSDLPSMIRRDYVMNANDSYWLSNPDAPLTGYPRMIGDENSERGMRTRIGIKLIRSRIAGTDGLPGRGFSNQLMRDMWMSGRSYLGEMWGPDLAALCAASPIGLGSSGLVNISEACPILADWDHSVDLDAPGALLFRRIALRLLGTSLPTGTTSTMRLFPTSGFLLPYDPSNPVDTPSGLRVVDPQVWLALADGVQEMRDLGIPLDATLRDYQLVERAGERFPIHGGVGALGVFSSVEMGWDEATGAFSEPESHMNTYVQVVSFEDDRCPNLQFMLGYGMSQDPTSPRYTQLTRRYADAEWSAFPYCEGDIQERTVETFTFSAPRR